MFCPKCGKEQFENAKFCHVCGASLSLEAEPARVPVPEPAPYRPSTVSDPASESYGAVRMPAAPEADSVPVRAEKKRSKKKPILIAAAALLLVLAIGVGAWFLLRRPVEKSGPRTVRDDMTAASQEVKTYLHRLPNLGRMIDNLDSLERGTGCSMDMEIQMNLGAERIMEQIRMQSDFGSKQSRVEMNMGQGSRKLGVQLYMDPDQIQIGGDELFGAGKVYCILTENLEERWNHSAIGQMLGENISIGMFNMDLWNTGFSDTAAPEKIETALERLYGEDWKTFRDSVKLEPCDAAECFAGQGNTYTLVWDSASIGRIGPKAEAALEEKKEALSGLSGLGALFGNSTGGRAGNGLEKKEIDLNELYAHGIVALLSKMDEGIRENNISNQICKNDRQQVIGIRIADLKDHELLVRLTGAEYPWEHITATMNGAEALDFVLEQTGSTLEATARVIADPEDPASERHTVELRYDDNTGRVEFDADGRSTNWIASGTVMDLTLRPEGEGIRVRISAKEDENDSTQYNFGSLISQIDVDLTVDPLRTPVKPLSDTPKDLLSMTTQEVQALMEEIEARIQAIMGY